jgi:6-phosphogluconolactonase
MSSLRFRLSVLIALIGAWVPALRADTVIYVSLAGEKKIVVYRMDGKLTRASEIALDGEPGALTTEPARRFLFASLRAEGKLAAFRIDAKTGKLTHINTVPAGADPAHISTDGAGRFLLCAYYVAAKVTVHRIGKDGALDEKPHQSVETADKAHAIVLDRSHRFAFVPHTGPNVIFQFRFDRERGELTASNQASLKTPEKSGPRHLVFHPGMPVAYVDNEQGGSVTAYRLNAKAGTLEPFQTLSTLPADFKGTNFCAEIRLHPTAKLLYVSNRGHDSIAGFKVNDTSGEMTSLGQTPTEKTPRSFDVDPSGRFLYAGGESSGQLAAYRIDAGTGKLDRFATYEGGKRLWWVMAVPLPK